MGLYHFQEVKLGQKLMVYFVYAYKPDCLARMWFEPHA